MSYNSLLDRGPLPRAAYRADTGAVDLGLRHCCGSTTSWPPGTRTAKSRRKSVGATLIAGRVSPQLRRPCVPSACPLLSLTMKHAPFALRSTRAV